MIKAFKSKTFFSFLIAGGIAAVVNFLSRFLYNVYFSYTVSILFAYITGMITAFLLTKFFVFEQSKNSTSKEFFYFTVINVLAVAQTILISLAFYNYIFPWLNFNFQTKAIAHAIGVVFPVFTSFLGHKHLSFRTENAQIEKVSE